MDADAARGRVLLEESRESVVVLDDEDRVIVASRRARESVHGLAEGERLPDGLLSGNAGIVPLVVPYEMSGRRERLVYLSTGGDLTAYEELRAGFTAAVSHELRTPLARLLSLLETATLPGEDVPDLVDRARAEVEQIRELIDEVLFLSELESGTRVVVLGAVPVRPELEAVVAELEERAGRAGVALVVEGDRSIELAMRPRMIRVVAQNLAANAIRYAGPGATFTLAVEREDGTIVLRGDGRRGRGRGGPAAAPVRAVLPRRSRPRLARHRARARDREAHRDAGRRDGGGARRLRRRARDPLHLSCRFCRVAAPSPVFHQTVTRRRPMRTTVRPTLATPMSETTTEVPVSTGIDPSKIGQLASKLASDGRGSEVVFDVEGLSVSYSGALALADVSLEIRKNYVTAFIGPSGCGKSTFIRCFNRMNDLIPGAVVDGRILYHGRDLYASNVDPVEVRRRIGMVFQKPNPFPKSVYDNIAFGPRVLKMSKNLDERVERALRHAALWDEVKDRLSENALGLSGGQQQRLCIARAVAVEPDVILMDEPASALDPISTSRIEDLIHELKRDYTIVIVTHNMQQAARVADMTAFFSVELREDGSGRHGILVEHDQTTKIFTNPSDRRTEDYVTGRFG